jgi:hypothetical protein
MERQASQSSWLGSEKPYALIACAGFCIGASAAFSGGDTANAIACVCVAAYYAWVIRS